MTIKNFGHLCLGALYTDNKSAIWHVFADPVTHYYKCHQILTIVLEI